MIKSFSNTIAAIATAPGEAGISIVRISGPKALEIADKIFRCKGLPPSKRSANTFILGYVHSSTGADDSVDADEVILLIYLAPHSYTREDVVEIQGHGGRMAAKRILKAALDAGADMAEPGEFTKRAFLNGRIDLLQAEAVMDIVRALSDRAASAAIEQLEGRLSSMFSRTYDELLNIAADMEATLDFPEDELPISTMQDIVNRIDEIIHQLEDILALSEEGRLLREGALVVISGRPNTGKSTLLNRLLCFDRAIVTDVPGTTRDTIEEQIIIDGIPIRLVDTAGLRNSESHVERIGVQRAQSFVKKADVNLYVMDCSQPLAQADIDCLKVLDPHKSIVLLNKKDLGIKITENALPHFSTILCSFLNNNDIPKVRKAIIGKMSIESSVPPHAAISERHRQIVQNALNEVNEAGNLLKNNREDMVVLAATSLRAALEQLGTITGRIYSNDLLDNIFRRFCVGK